MLSDLDNVLLWVGVIPLIDQLPAYSIIVLGVRTKFLVLNSYGNIAVSDAGGFSNIPLGSSICRQRKIIFAERKYLRKWRLPKIRRNHTLGSSTQIEEKKTIREIFGQTYVFSEVFFVFFFFQSLEVWFSIDHYSSVWADEDSDCLLLFFFLLQCNSWIHSHLGCINGEFILFILQRMCMCTIYVLVPVLL